jgi:hypothetical protein
VGWHKSKKDGKYEVYVYDPAAAQALRRPARARARGQAAVPAEDGRVPRRGARRRRGDHVRGLRAAVAGPAPRAGDAPAGAATREHNEQQLRVFLREFGDRPIDGGIRPRRGARVVARSPVQRARGQRDVQRRDRRRVRAGEPVPQPPAGAAARPAGHLPDDRGGGRPARGIARARVGPVRLRAGRARVGALRRLGRDAPGRDVQRRAARPRLRRTAWCGSRA